MSDERTIKLNTGGENYDEIKDFLENNGAFKMLLGSYNSAIEEENAIVKNDYIKILFKASIQVFIQYQLFQKEIESILDYDKLQKAQISSNKKMLDFYHRYIEEIE